MIQIKEGFIKMKYELQEISEKIKILFENLRGYV
tara:strand:+ start:513 stop:614 length:102 start_codon:yes stop_codon:yes gene_type:complete